MKSAIAVAAVLAASGAAQAGTITILDNSSLGSYNDSIGTALNGTSAVFPTSGDPTIDVTVAPDLSAAGAILGDWLGDPANLNGNWSAPQAIPRSWAVGTETAIVYRFGGSGQTFENIQLDLGVDNGIFAWLNGQFLGGQLRPGTSSLGELSFNLGDLSGTNYLQILREDHGGVTSYDIRMTAESQRTDPIIPAPTASLLGAAGLGFTAARRRR